MQKNYRVMDRISMDIIRRYQRWWRWFVIDSSILDEMNKCSLKIINITKSGIHRIRKNYKNCEFFFEKLYTKNNNIIS